MTYKLIRLKKNHDRRIQSGHIWIYSNEIDANTPLKNFSPGEVVLVEAADHTPLGMAYVNPHSLIAGRIYSPEIGQSLDQTFFIKKIKQARQLRGELFSKPFYRLVFSEGDHLPGVIIDRFNHDFVVQINTAGMDAKKDELIKAMLAVFPDTNSILFRNDTTVREQEGLERTIAAGFGNPPEEITIEENDVKFVMPLWKGQKTGWFYDHRLNRARLKSYVLGKKVLDVFSYLGSFSIQAAVNGAREVDCIESSAFACDYIKRNALLNHVQNKVNVICSDAFDAMKELLQSKNKYDVIILDPPAFVKKFKDQKEGLLAYQRINELAVKLLKTDGILVSCSCSMHVSEEDLLRVLQRVAFRTQTKLQLIEQGHQAPDHPIHINIPETNYLKALFFRKIL